MTWPSSSRAGRATVSSSDPPGRDAGYRPGPAQLVQVIGYPNATEPITCTVPARGFGAHQMEFDCDGYTNGTSGGPFLARVSPEAPAWVR